MYYCIIDLSLFYLFICVCFQHKVYIVLSSYTPTFIFSIDFQYSNEWKNVLQLMKDKYIDVVCTAC